MSFRVLQHTAVASVLAISLIGIGCGQSQPVLPDALLFDVPGAPPDLPPVIAADACSGAGCVPAPDGSGPAPDGSTPGPDGGGPDVSVRDGGPLVDAPAGDGANPPPVDGGPGPDGTPPAGAPVGAACTAGSDCQDGSCLGLPGGYCTRADCVNAGCPAGSTCFQLSGGSSACFKDCAAAADCRGEEGYICDGDNTCYPGAAAACQPPPVDPAPAGCYATATSLGLSYQQTSSPHDLEPDLNVYCDIDQPLRLSGPVHGVRFFNSNGTEASMLMACSLALQIEKLTAILSSLGVVRVDHLGTYNCRAIAGTTTLSEHGHGTAIDLAKFTTTDGTTYTVLGDWDPMIAQDANGCDFPYTPPTVKGRWLLDLAERLCNERVFNIVLTPNFNEAHDNHMHVDLTADACFLG
jgi:hypothetical protein